MVSLALVALPVAVACDRERPTAGPAVSPPLPAPIPEGYRRIDVAAEGFTVDVPAAWQDVPHDPEAVRRLVEASRQGNPRLAAMLETSVTSSGEEAKLLVIDGRPPGANVNVLKVPNERTIAAGELRQARDDLLDPAVTAGIDTELQAAGARDIRREKAELASGPALRASYVLPVQAADGAVSDISGVQYYVPSEEAIFILSFSTPDPAAYAADFERIVQSFAVR